jgi:hypothetical protein
MENEKRMIGGIDEAKVLSQNDGRQAIFGHCSCYSRTHGQYLVLIWHFHNLEIQISITP